MSITLHFADLRDPRSPSNALRHSLHDILVVALCATLCGAETFTEMEEFGCAKLSWLRERLGLHLSWGIPSHDTFGRVFAALAPEEFAACFQRWTQEIQHHSQGEIIAIDGKTLRRSFDNASGKAAIHMVSAWAGRNRLVLGQQAVEAKSNEITAIPSLLKILDLTGCIVTVDALNCQKTIADQICRQGGDYLFALKGNHPWLHEDVAAYFDWALGQVSKGKDSSSFFSSEARSQDYAHGRREERRCWCIEANVQEWNRALEAWPGLRSLVLVESERRMSQSLEGGATTWSTPTYERRYYLSSLSPQSAAAMLEAAREHWGIENSVHWVLDVVFREDESRIRKDNAPVNMAMLRQLCLNLLRQDKTHKRGIKARRLRAALDEDYLVKVIAGQKA